MHENLDAGRLVASMFDLMRDNAIAVAASIAGLSALGVASDMHDPEALTSVPISIASMVAQFIVVRSALERLGLVQRSGRAVGAYVGVSILATLGILLGLVLLVIPGVVLAIRWSVVAPIVLAEEQGVAESLRESWARTKGHFAAILVASLVPFVPLAGGIVAYAMTDPETVQIPLAASVVANICINAFLALNWLLSVAIYSAVMDAREPLEEIFA